MFIVKFPQTSFGQMGGWACLPSVRSGRGTFVWPLAPVEWVVWQTLRREFGSYGYLGIVMGVFAVFCCLCTNKYKTPVTLNIYTRIAHG